MASTQWCACVCWLQDKEVDSKSIYDTFVQFGTIISAKVATDSSGASKGYAFVQFDSADAAQNAIDKVNGMELAGKKVRRARAGDAAPSDGVHMIRVFA